MKVAIVHERLDVVGGAERVVLALHRLFPDAPVFTSFVDYSNLTPEFRQLDIRTSPLQKLPAALKKRPHWLLPFDMLAFSDFDMSSFDLVISSNYVAAKSVITPAETCHICYCHTPMRSAWDLYPAYISGRGNPIIKQGLRLLLHYFRVWDVQNSNNVDYFIANSETVRRRIRKHYRRNSEVIYPPVQTTRFAPTQEPEDFYLTVSRLVPYKRIDLAVEAFNRLQRPLKIVGTGRELARLKAMAGPNISFLGWQDDATVAHLLSTAKALIFPGEEDFGILPVEAQAAGLPVIAYGRGGALETVRHEETGYLFAKQTAADLADAVLAADEYDFDRERIAARAARFDESAFLDHISNFVSNCLKDFQDNQFLDRELRHFGMNGEPDDMPVRASIRLPAKEASHR